MVPYLSYMVECILIEMSTIIGRIEQAHWYLSNIDAKRRPRGLYEMQRYLTLVCNIPLQLNMTAAIADHNRMSKKDRWIPQHLIDVFKFMSFGPVVWRRVRWDFWVLLSTSTAKGSFKT